MLKRLTYRLLYALLWTPLLSAKAEPTYSFDELTHMLQSEYRSQLKQKPPASVQKAKQARSNSPTPRDVRQLKPRKLTPHASPRPQQINKAPPKPRHQPQATSEKPEPEALFNAASSGNNSTIARLLSQGININVANNERETALHMAAAHGHYSTVIYLINHGANLHARTIKNWLPLHHATRFRHANIANYLKQRGSSPYARTSDRMSAIDMAESANDKRLIYILKAR